MPKSWAEVEASPQFQTLQPEQREAARQQYFETVVAPRVPPEQLEVARGQFDQATQREYTMADVVPLAPSGPLTPTGGGDNRNFLTRAWDAVANDPVLGMWGHGLSTLAMAAPETLMNSVNNAGAEIYGGIGSLGDMLLNPMDESKWSNSIDYARQNYEMQPRGESAKAVAEGLGEALSPVANAKRAVGEGVLNATGSPFLATLADIAPETIATVAGAPRAKIPFRDATAATGADLGEALAGGQVPALPPNTPVTRARRAGYNIMPSNAERINVQTPGKFREKFAPSGTRRDFVLKNQKNTNKLAAEEIGVPAGTRLDEAAFSAVKQPHFNTYKMAESVAKRGPISEEFAALLEEGAKQAKFKTADKKGITEVIGALRDRAKRGLQSDRLAEQDYGESLLDLADNIEAEFGKHLETVNAPDVLKNYQSARQSLAKINDVEQATRADQVDPQIIYKRGEKGSKLSGRLKMIADAAEHFKDETATSISDAGRMEKKGGIAGAKDLAAKAVLKIPGLGDVLDIRSEGFQNKLGRKATPEEESYFASYGQYPDMAPLKVKPQIEGQGEMFGSYFEPDVSFENLEGQIGTAPSTQRMRDFGADQTGRQRGLGLGEALDLENAPGAFGITRQDVVDAHNAQIANDMPALNQESLDLGTPLELKKPPGRVGKTKAPPKGIPADEFTPEEIAYIQQFLGK